MLHPVRKSLPKRSVGFNFGKDKVRGLNIGGWLVLEPYDLSFLVVFELILIVADSIMIDGLRLRYSRD